MLMYLSFSLLFIVSFMISNGKIINQNAIVRVPNQFFKWDLKLILILFLISIISAFRETNIGTDYHNYIDFYNFIYNNGSFSNILKRNEIGWDYINYFFAVNNVPYQLFFGFISFSIYYFFIKGSYKYQYLLPLMFFFLFSSGFFYWTLSGLRQSVAIMIFFFSIKYIIEEKLYKYIIAIILASLFHTSALIMLPIYFLRYIKFNQKIVFILFTISLIFIGNTFFLELIDKYIFLLGNKIEFLNKYMQYIESSKIAINDDRSSTGLGVLIKIITTYYIIYKSKFIINKFPEFNIYFLLFIISAISSNIFYSIELIARVMNYFYVTFPIVIAASFYYTEKTIEKYINLVFLSINLILFLLITYKITII